MVSTKTLAAKKKAAIKKKMSAGEFLATSLVASHVATQVQTIVDRYSSKERVRIKIVCNPKLDWVAYTDNREIHINTGCAFFDGRSYEDALDILYGLVLHECGHILYTDFGINRLLYDALNVGRWYPDRPTFKNPKYDEYLDKFEMLWKSGDRQRRILFSLIKNIDNILEDGFIELELMNNFEYARLTEGLYFLREVQFSEFETVEEMQSKTFMMSTPEEDRPEKGIHFMNAILNELLCFAKYGEIKMEYEDEKDLDLYKVMVSIMALVNKCVSAHDANKRKSLVNKIVVALTPYISDYVDYIMSLPEQEPSDGDGRGDGTAAGDMGMPSVSSSSSGTPVASKALKSEASKEKSDKEPEPDDETTGASEDSDSDEKSASEASGDDDDSDGDGSEGDGDSDGEMSDTDGEKTSKAKDPKRLKMGSRAEAASGDGSMEKAETTEIHTGAGDEIADLLDKMATTEAEAEVEAARTAELRDEFGAAMEGLHSRCNVHVERLAHVPDELKAEYDKCSAQLTKYAKQTTKLLAQQLKAKAYGGRQEGLYFGQKLEARALIRNDGKCFSNRRLPQNTAPMAFAILIDESGSMSGSRINAARTTAIILYEACCNLKIPCCVYGHSADQHGHGSLDLYSYCEFDKVDKNDKYRLMNVAARSQNRDGAALQAMYKKLEARPEKNKVLLVISDGQPCASGYYGEDACADMQNIVKKSNRKGMKTFAAAIGSDKPAINGIYGEGFIDISDLDQMPKILLKLLKKQLS